MTTNPVLENIRKALGRDAQTPIGQRPAIYPARTPKSLDAEIEQFFNELRTLSGVGKRLSSTDIETELKALVAEKDIRKATVWNTPHLTQLQVANKLASFGVELVSPNADKNEMAQCDLGVTEADYLLSETGTIVLRSSAEKPRAVSLLPRIHLAIVHPEMFRDDLHQVFAEARDSHYLVCITGPSRTADIELTLALGVHGPKNLYVWMIE